MTELPLLFSYHYYQKKSLVEYIEIYRPYHYEADIFVDSGGFSAFTQGVEIDIKDYIRWIKANQEVIGIYANLDAIGNAAQTWANHQKMLDAGLTPMPVFHTGEDFKWLEKYLETNDYIALGGMVPYAGRKNVLIPWIIKCFRMAEATGRKIKFHGFGVTNWKIVRSFKWASVDSSSWATGVRYRRMSLFDEATGTWGTPFHIVTKKAKNPVYNHANYLRNIGINPDDLAQNEPPRNSLLAPMIHSYIRSQDWLENKQRTKLYLAEANNPTDLITGLETIHNNTCNIC